VFLLALQIECPYHPNTEYVTKLKDCYDRDVSASLILVWFRDRYNYAGTYKVSNLVPIDKWMMHNTTRVMLYRGIMDIMFPDHLKWNFLDEKHVVNNNKDCLPKTIRADPLTGYIEALEVSGDFCEARNIFAVISGSLTKLASIVYHIMKQNGNACQFVAFSACSIFCLSTLMHFRPSDVTCELRVMFSFFNMSLFLILDIMSPFRLEIVLTWTQIFLCKFSIVVVVSLLHPFSDSSEVPC
jgi:hypothetical protein